MIWFVSSDIHSFYDEWQIALEEAGFEEDNDMHGIIVCGDLFDRGKQPLECLQFAVDMHRKGRAIFIKGNHEDLLEELIDRRFGWGNDYSNGTMETCKILSGGDFIDWGKLKNDVTLNYYLDNCLDFYEINNYIFVHGWIPVTYKYDDNATVWDQPKMIKDPKWRKGDWKEARWLNGMHMWHSGITIRGKTIVCGHWHSSYGNHRFHDKGYEHLDDAWREMSDSEQNLCQNAREITSEVKALYNKYVDSTKFVDKGIIALDARTVISGRVNVLVGEDGR